MSNARRTYSAAEELALNTQVGGICPRCGKPLFFTKRVGKPPKPRQFKDYELAHIYPLNPTPQELLELAGVTLLCDDVNDPANLIPLCTNCHNRFDKPRTRADYEDLAAKKRDLIAEDVQKALRREYPIEEDIHLIVARLFADASNGDESMELEYDPKRLADKFDSSLPPPTRHKIRAAVAGYYSVVKSEFAELERKSPSASTLIFAQVRVFYVKQKSLGLAQGDIFRNVVRWIGERTSSNTVDAAELVAAFFVQNCEVFD